MIPFLDIENSFSLNPTFIGISLSSIVISKMLFSELLQKLKSLNPNIIFSLLSEKISSKT